jgi:uracil-DNA glycosylase
VGRSGQLLRKVLTEVGLDTNALYIANIVKVRPPANRDPSLDEIEAYRPYLEQEIAIIKPKLIVTLGRFSMAAFLPDVKISQVHGRLHRVVYAGVQYYVLPLYHPAAALRGTTVLEAFKHDVQKIPKIVEWIGSQKQLDDVNLAAQVESILLQ